MLVANRGEIAVRVTRTLRRLGIESVAIFSDADAGAPHVRAADRALRIGPAAPAESYLNVERVVDAAVRSGAEALHPGYGFLSERPELARACERAGVAFVGPGPEAMALLGDKVAAQEAATAAGVPVLPGLRGELGDEEILAWAADREPPLLLKAAAGGGGRGMRVVQAREELPEALASARREALGAFGDDRLLVERYVERSRHIEVQVIADSHGNVVHLGERECSLQRRHQKVVEESPSPVVDAQLRDRMGEAAVALAHAGGYVNAGTVELIAERDDPASFFFLEVNTRLQVEHPVTEAVTGLDLVELQLRVAAGEPLPLRQEDVRLDGHAVEARIYAEDPAAGFLPSAGPVVAYREPAGARLDSGVAAGVEVGTEYDPMLAKAIVHAPGRAEALARLDGALGDLVLLGPTTNVAYLRALLVRPEVRDGEIDTGLIERLGDEVAPPPPDPAAPAVAAAALLGSPDGDDPWEARDGWRPAGPAWSRTTLDGPDGPVEVALRAGPGRGEWSFELHGETGSFVLADRLLRVGEEARGLGLEPDGDGVWLLDGRAAPARFAPRPEGAAGERRRAAGSLQAPMPGTVLDVRAEPGAAVAEGDVLVVLESMKMETAVQSPGDGVVSEVLVAAGDRVGRGAALIALAEPGGGEA